MKLLASGWTAILARAALCTAAIAGIASCGSGAVSAPPTTVVPGAISITPSTATVYSEVPTTFFITGGNGSYLIASSDQSALPATGTFAGSQLTLVPNSVSSDVPVTLTVRDTGTSAPATAALTVKPRTVSNVVTVTPSASQSTACGVAVCSGGDAEIKTVLTRNGVPLAGRVVRFDIISGDLRVITSPAGVSETLSLSGTAVTDDSGTARMRVRALSNAGSQTAIMQITDTSSGFVQSTSITIAPASNAALDAQPRAVEFRGPDFNTCASGISADVIVVGGRPPYLISQPSAFVVSPQVVTFSGGRFTISATGQCANATAIAVVDSNGASVTVTAENRVSAATPTTVEFAISPTAVTLDSCNAIATVAVVGGSGTYFATSGSEIVSAVMVRPNQLEIRRTKPSGPTTLGKVPVAVSDGKTVRNVDVTLSSGAQISCSP